MWYQCKHKFKFAAVWRYLDKCGLKWWQKIVIGLIYRHPNTNSDQVRQKLYRSDGQVDRASASEAVATGSIPVSGQAEDVKKMAFTASLLGVQH